MGSSLDDPDLFPSEAQAFRIHALEVQILADILDHPLADDPKVLLPALSRALFKLAATRYPKEAARSILSLLIEQFDLLYDQAQALTSSRH